MHFLCRPLWNKRYRHRSAQILANLDPLSNPPLFRAGIGFGLMDRITAKKWPELIEVPLPNGSFTVPTWLVTTRALYSTKRIKFVFDFFAEQLVESEL
ncbi:hypothetical protein [Glaciecola sp. KUL10]|uniref:hypothetical protein n=1 Tax=Glaciecola sp. (strain KUL10) TaxID=2161813 RepID=UPI001313E144|nr:hypothetical protein [Glaciecola sp. KUL10]